MENNNISELANTVKEADSHWIEVMKLAEKYGFVMVVSGGVAIVGTHKTQLEQGVVEYTRIQRMNGCCPKEHGLPGCFHMVPSEKGEREESYCSNERCELTALKKREM